MNERIMMKPKMQNKPKAFITIFYFIFCETVRVLEF